MKDDVKAITQDHMEWVFGQDIYFSKIHLSISEIRRRKLKVSDLAFSFSGFVWFTENLDPLNVDRLTKQAFDKNNLAYFESSLKQSGIDFFSISVEHIDQAFDSSATLNEQIYTEDGEGVGGIVGLAVAGGLLTAIAGFLIYRRDAGTKVEEVWTDEATPNLEIEVFAQKPKGDEVSSLGFKAVDRGGSTYNYQSEHSGSQFADESSFSGSERMPQTFDYFECHKAQVTARLPPPRIERNARRKPKKNQRRRRSQENNEDNTTSNTDDYNRTITGARYPPVRGRRAEDILTNDMESYFVGQKFSSPLPQHVRSASNPLGTSSQFLKDNSTTASDSISRNPHSTSNSSGFASYRQRDSTTSDSTSRHARSISSPSFLSNLEPEWINHSMLNQNAGYSQSRRVPTQEGGVSSSSNESLGTRETKELLNNKKSKKGFMKSKWQPGKIGSIS